MKKTTIVILLLLAFNSIKAQEFKAKITYQATLNTDSYLQRLEKDSIMPDSRKEHRIKRAADAVPTNFHLFINGNESLYKAEHDMETNRRLGLLLNQTGNVGMHQNAYYVNTETEEGFYESFWTQGVLVNMDKIDWVLTQETKKIGEYLCYKATAIIETEQTHGMSFLNPVVAWYTPQIPVPFGIQTFKGLPGLTLELLADFENGKIFYRATKIELNPEEEIKIKKPKGKQVSEQKYVELMKNMSRR